MSLKEGAETVVDQCLKIQGEEEALVLNDGNDPDLIDSLLEVLDERKIDRELLEYEEPENHGEEPPEKVAERMKQVDVVIAPTKKSISHTEARREACENGARVVTLPGIDREIWETSLQADYSKVKANSEKAFELLESTDKVRIETPSGTELELEVDTEYFHTDTGLIHEEGGFGNLPAGEADGAPLNASGRLVIDHFPFAPEGTEVEVKEGKVVAVKHPEGEGSELAEKLEKLECARNIAEFGFGTNPEATLIGNVLQDEKVLGTVHIAFGDNSSYRTGKNRVECPIHWDTVCESPTVWFDDLKVLDRGEPVFLEN